MLCSAELCNIDLLFFFGLFRLFFLFLFRLLSACCALRLPVRCILEHVLRAARIEVDSVLFGEGGQWRIGHHSRASNRLNFTARSRSLRPTIFALLSLSVFLSGVVLFVLRRDVLLEVLLVAEKVLCAGQRVLEKDHDREEHF